MKLLYDNWNTIILLMVVILVMIETRRRMKVEKVILEDEENDGRRKENDININDENDERQWTEWPMKNSVVIIQWKIYNERNQWRNNSILMKILLMMKKANNSSVWLYMLNTKWFNINVVKMKWNEYIENGIFNVKQTILILMINTESINDENEEPKNDRNERRGQYENILMSTNILLVANGEAERQWRNETEKW